MTNDWNLFMNNCTLISGLEKYEDRPISCGLIYQTTTYVVEDF